MPIRAQVRRSLILSSGEISRVRRDSGGTGPLRARAADFQPPRRRLARARLRAALVAADAGLAGE